MKRSTTAVIVGVLALGLVGGGTAVALTGQEPAPAETTLTEPTATPDTGQPTTDETPAGDATEPLTAKPSDAAPSADTLFLADVHDRLDSLGAATIIPDATDDQLIKAGHEACDALTAGTPFDDLSVINGEGRVQGSYLDSAMIATSGVLFYCPELNGTLR